MIRNLFALLAISLLLSGLANVACGDDVDPEPPGGTARKLRGTWVSERRILKGKEGPHPVKITFTFKGKEATYSYGTNKFALKFEADKNRPYAFLVFGKGGNTPDRYFFKIVKGELYLTLQRGKDPKTKPDFQGNTMPVIIYKKQK